MTNRGKSLNNRRANNKLQNDDDTCSVTCYKDSSDGHVGVIRIRQQPTCSACNIVRGTLSLYCKHIADNVHLEKVKKLCDENRFVPSIYDQAIHLALQNNIYYQTEQFHFLYKHTDEEPDSSSEQIKLSDKEKMEINNDQEKTTPTNTRKRRNIQVTLVFQDKTYTRIGTASAQIREQLLKDMLTGRANDVAALPMEIYYMKKKRTPHDIHHNAQKGAVVILPTAEDQSQVLLKKEQQQQEPFENGRMSSSENSREDNSVVKQKSAITTHEISATEKFDVNEQSSFVDDVMNVCKDVLNNIIVDAYTNSYEFKREQRFLTGVARRKFKKINTFYCDICLVFLTSEKYCKQHLNGSDHLEKIRHYETDFLPWRKAMQKSIISDKTIKDIMGSSAYDNYKATMALYLSPNNLVQRGRFCCGYCELVFTDQWFLEKHLHTIEHKEKQTKHTSIDHKELVVRFANVSTVPLIFKLNGVTHLSEIPEDIRDRYRLRGVTRAELDDDISSFIRNYPFDSLEGSTRILNDKAQRKQKSSVPKLTTQNNNIAIRNQQRRRGGFNRTRGGQFQAPAAHQRTAMKRPFPATAPPPKRFRPDHLNNSFPGANRGLGPMRNFAMEQHGYGRPVSYNNANDRWPPHYSTDQQQRPEFSERSNFALRSLAPDNNGHYGGQLPHRMSEGSNYNNDRQSHFNDGGRGYNNNNQQLNYNPNFIRAVAPGVANYHPEQNPTSLVGPPTRPHHRANTGPTNELMHHVPNNLQRPQQQQQPPSMPPMVPIHHQNQNSFGGFGVNNSSNTNSSFFPFSANQQPNQMGVNNPPVRSYADYRASSALPAGNIHPSMYPTLTNTQNPVVPQSRTFDEFGLSSLAQGSSNPYGQLGRLSFGNEEPRHGNFGHQNQMGQPPQASWRGSPRGGSNVRGRSGGGRFQTTNKQPGSTFSYSSSNNKNNSPIRGRGAGRNARNFGSRR